MEQLLRTAHSVEELHSPETPEQALPSHGKSAFIAVWTCQSHLPWGSPSLLQSDPASPTHLLEMPHGLKENWPTSSALGKHSTAVPGKTLPSHGEYTYTKKKKITSKMKKLRSHSQLNQQENSPKVANNETELCSLTDLEFKREILKILKELREDMNNNADSLRKELENIRRSQEKLKNSFAEIQTELKAIKTRMNNAEEGISEVEDRIMEITQTGQQTENQMKKHESNLRDLWDNIRRANLCTIGIPEGVEKDKGIENIFAEIIAGNFPNLKDTEFRIQEAQRTPNKLNPNRPTPRHIIIKMAKVNDKERILKAAREKQNVTYKGTPIRLSADFSTETLQARREWQEIFKVLKEKNLQPRILYPARISFKIEGEIKNFSNKQKLKKYSNTKPILKEILKGLV
uniref:L1 transposable element RRM domain-containing protein n=1 Tax=Sus scrofa TaxID=9823 RepID=A0A8D0VAQ2_PIG